MLHLQPQCLVSCCCRISPSLSSFTQIWSLQHLCTEVCHSFYIGFGWRSLLSPPPSYFGIPLHCWGGGSWLIVAIKWQLVDCCHQRVPLPAKILSRSSQSRNSLDLPAPPGLNVNNGIHVAHNLCSAAQMVTRCRCSALMTKTDLQSAYRHGTVNGEDQHLLGIEWDRTTYIDRALPLTSDADFRCCGWASIRLEMWGVHNCVHCLDDFLL